MEKVKCICVMRELMLALSDFEQKLLQTHKVSLNEAMVLCAVGYECVTATQISECTGLRPSNTSKIIGSLEEQRLIVRRIGEEDKRQMYLSLTNMGLDYLNRLKDYKFDIPELLKPIFESK